MTDNTKNTTLVEYNQEIQPKIRKLLELKEALKEWIAEDEAAQECVQEIKAKQDDLKAWIEEKNPDLLREIKDLEVDIKLACKAASKVSDYSSAELKAYLTARAKETVEKTFEKAASFSDLEMEFV